MKCVSNNASGGRLKLFSVIKQDFSFEKYLSKIKDVKHRRVLTQFRISSHRLAIETGRHTRIARKNRLCKSCSAGEIEDEAHILLSCSAFTDKRSTFFQSIESLHPGFISFDDSISWNFFSQI